MAIQESRLTSNDFKKAAERLRERWALRGGIKAKPYLILSRRCVARRRWPRGGAETRCITQEPEPAARPVRPRRPVQSRTRSASRRVVPPVVFYVIGGWVAGARGAGPPRRGVASQDAG